ncbi:hypothetical protein [Flavobacterium davisii]|uniref:Uncharacterized protein n=1 Tax=Flavobacterium columnare TaxID=996 RepID=A0A8G0KYQ8_9FLAO|nr:hypothetical protein [Flavobacterium davisii]QYS90040.1 hypothetical protein JJC05_08030 [Flavobacterium davisii]
MNEHWMNEQLIGINCLQKNDGTIIIFNCFSYSTENKKQHFCVPVCDTTVESIEKYNDDIWTYFEKFSNEIIIDNKFKIYGGEGSMGNEGFIACVDLSDNLLWAIFLTDSNPFYKIEFENNQILAYSSNNLLYKINFSHPERIDIEYKEWS